jgi:hypothetical protein
MRCDNWIDESKVSKNGNLLKSAVVATRDIVPAIRRKRYSHLVPCHGDIKASVALIEEPYFGGSSPALDVEYKCSRCKSNLYGPELPRDTDTIAEILTEHIRKQKQRKG